MILINNLRQILKIIYISSQNRLEFIPKCKRRFYITFLHIHILPTDSRLKYLASFKNANCTVSEKKTIQLMCFILERQESIYVKLNAIKRAHTHAHSENIEKSISFNKKPQNSRIAHICTKFLTRRYCHLARSYSIFYPYKLFYLTFSQINALPTEY